MKTAYLLSQDELRVLLKGNGCDNVTGIFLSQSKMDEQTVLNTLNKLVKRGLISSNQTGFVMTAELREIITCLGTSKVFFAVQSKIKSLPNLCCYIGDHVLVCDVMKQRSYDVKLSMLSYDEFLLLLHDEGYLPDDEWEIPINDDELAEYENNLEQAEPLNEALGENSKIFLSIAMLGYSCNMVKRLEVITYPLYNYIKYYSDTGVNRCIYSFKRLATVFKGNICLSE